MLKFNDGLQLLHCLSGVQNIEHRHCSEKYVSDTLANKYGDTVVEGGH